MSKIEIIDQRRWVQAWQASFPRNVDLNVFHTSLPDVVPTTIDVVRLLIRVLLPKD